MRMQKPSVDVLIDQLVAGDLTINELVAEFARRNWSMPAMSLEQLWRGDEEPPRANYWEVVEVARQLGDITEEQYEILAEARGPVRWR